MRAALALVAVVATAGGAEACTLSVPGNGWQRIESARYVMAFRPQAAPTVGKIFALDFALCPKTGGLPQRIQVDAYMPAHRHGMNYRPSVSMVAEGRYRADGLLLHMPGRWEFQFELSADGRTDRLASHFDLDG